jgi:hypothetical protein
MVRGDAVVVDRNVIAPCPFTEPTAVEVSVTRELQQKSAIMAPVGEVIRVSRLQVA